MRFESLERSSDIIFATKKTKNFIEKLGDLILQHEKIKNRKEL